MQVAVYERSTADIRSTRRGAGLGLDVNGQKALQAIKPGVSICFVDCLLSQNPRRRGQQWSVNSCTSARLCDVCDIAALPPVLMQPRCNAAAGITCVPDPSLHVTDGVLVGSLACSAHSGFQPCCCGCCFVMHADLLDKVLAIASILDCNKVYKSDGTLVSWAWTDQSSY